MPATIKLGSTGADVSTWQGLLTAAGFSAAVTGAFDASTQTATKAWQAAKGLVADGIVGPASWSKMLGKPVVAPDPNAAFGRQVLLNVWKEVTGEEPSLPELQIVGANAHLESNYGKASYHNDVTNTWSGPINNWGAVQAGPPPCDPAKSFEASDTHGDGTKYTFCYRKYATPEEGAKDLIKQMTVRRPASWALMKKGDIDAWAEQMHAAVGKKDPISGVPGYFEQDPKQRAKGIEQRVVAIAAALDEPITAVRGGPYVDPNQPGGLLPGVTNEKAQKGLLAIVFGALAYGAYRLIRRGGK